MKEINAYKGSVLSAENCIVMWDNLDECANRILEPFCETNNEHGKGTQKAKMTRRILKTNLVVQPKR